MDINNQLILAGMILAAAPGTITAIWLIVSGRHKMQGDDLQTQANTAKAFADAAQSAATQAKNASDEAQDAAEDAKKYLHLWRAAESRIALLETDRETDRRKMAQLEASERENKVVIMDLRGWIEDLCDDARSHGHEPVKMRPRTAQ